MIEQSNSIKQPIQHPLTDQYRKDLINNKMQPYIIDHNHLQRHNNNDNVTTLDRLLSDKKETSTFNSSQECEMLINHILYNNMNEILTWRDDISTEHNDRLVLKIETEGFGDVGIGYKLDQNNTIKEYQTPDLRMIIDKDNNNRQYGFNITTFYPDMYSDKINPTHCNLRSRVKKTPTYQQERPLKQAYRLYQTNPENNTLITYCDHCHNKKTGENEHMLQMRLDVQNKKGDKGQHIISMYETNRLIIATMNADDKRVKSIYTREADLINQEKHNNRPTDPKRRSTTANLNHPRINKLFENAHPEQAKIFKELSEDFKHCSYEKQQLKKIQPSSPTLINNQPIHRNITEKRINLIKKDNVDYGLDL